MPQAYRLNLPSASQEKQIEGKANWNSTRQEDSADFFTLGYTGRRLDSIIESLKAHGVRTLVDIRRNPVSMYRPELSKNNLDEVLSHHGIIYMHVRELGVPRDVRAKAVESGTREVVWEWYDDLLGNYFNGNLHSFLNGFEFPIALMCTEIDPHECHRHRLALVLEKMGMMGFDI
jgi:uncharacterized protein (DUF488 family)